MPQLGPLEILVIFVVALLVFGPSKLPEIGRQVGRGVSEFRKFQQTLRRDLDGMLGHDEHDDQSAAAQPAPMLPPKEPAPQDWTEPPDQPQLGDAFGPEPNGATAAAVNPAGDEGEPMLPLPWPDPLPPPPPPPPPDDSAPVDRT
jgi:TatA/E family protein of Tat protein translocase